MVRKIFFASAVIAPLLIVFLSLWWAAALWAFVVAGPLIALGFFDVNQRKHALLRIYPVIGHGRYLMEEIRPEIQQYFVESNTNGMPFNREFRSIVYQRAKGDLDTRAFGTQRDVDRVGYEWMNHSLAPKPVATIEPRVTIGGEQCEIPYESSHLNISAMSFGSLSRNAILALNGGARIGGFAHNTGEGGISGYHLEPGGDLTWQIGTGYFGCRTLEGGFDPSQFADKSQHECVRMIEIKLSQGAKPAHGGILPKEKVTAEIAEIRGVPMGHDVISPPAHSAFSKPSGLLEFVARLRELSGGKPVGFKLCIGFQTEFLSICKAMLQTGIRPDFITVDGAEGGTGAAPLELTNSVGMPMRDGLRFVHNSLRGCGLRNDLRLIAAGKIVTAFHIVRTIALGADLCNIARPMLLALGCIQARSCNTNKCPVGIATQDPSRSQGLVVKDKANRVAEFHRATIHAFLELLAGGGLESPREIRPEQILRRIDTADIKNFAELYPTMDDGILLDSHSIPERWAEPWGAAMATRWS
jgi:glutamate synthase domain-containing protein 2